MLAAAAVIRRVGCPVTADGPARRERDTALGMGILLTEAGLLLMMLVWVGKNARIDTCPQSDRRCDEPRVHDRLLERQKTLTVLGGPVRLFGSFSAAIRSRSEGLASESRSSLPIRKRAE